MMKVFIPLTAFIFIISIFFVFKTYDQKLSAKLELVEISDCGHVEFKLTNSGHDLEYVGYFKNYPLNLIDIKSDGVWVEDFGPMCGTGLENYILKSGESMNFISENHLVAKKVWRFSLDISKPDRVPSWAKKVMRYFNYEQDIEYMKIYSQELQPVYNPQEKIECKHKNYFDFDIEEPPVDEGIE